MNYKNLKKILKNYKAYLNLKKSFPIILIVFGLIGLFASSALVVEKIALIREPEQELVCDLNPVYSCSSVILSDQSEILGFPNEIMGIAMFAAIVTVGAIVISGVELKKWIWKLFALGMIGSMAFVFWFFYESVYAIGSLCIFCTIVWFSIWAITSSGFAWMYDKKIFKIPKNYTSLAKFARKNVANIWLLLILVFVILILENFWYYYGTRIGF